MGGSLGLGKGSASPLDYQLQFISAEDQLRAVHRAQQYETLGFLRGGSQQPRVDMKELAVPPRRKIRLVEE